MSAAFSSMFAAGAYTANEHADGSTDNNVVIEKFLWSLNNLRYQHDAPPVYWNVTLWEFATNWANKCPDSHSFGPYGETMGSGSQDAAFDMNSFGEEASWNGQVVTTTDDFMKSGHFFTEMWKATTYIGCARVWCDNDNTGKPINAWISVCEYEYSASTDGFAGNISARSNTGPPKDWDPPENHVSFSSFPPIVSPAQAWPSKISGTVIPSLGPTLVDLPPDVIASATAHSYGVAFTGTTDSDTNPVVGPTKTPGAGALSGSELPTYGPTKGAAVTPSNPSGFVQPSMGATTQMQPDQPAPQQTPASGVSAQAVPSDIPSSSSPSAGSMVTPPPNPPASTFAHVGNTEQPAQAPSSANAAAPASVDSVVNSLASAASAPSDSSGAVMTEFVTDVTTDIVYVTAKA